jgi:anti-sigma factor ChrR (cupin superfamily)
MHPNDTTLNDYIDGALDATERASVEQHLSACAACREVIEDLQAILAATRDLDANEPPVRAWPRLERAIRVEREHAASQQSGGGVAAAGRAGARPPASPRVRTSITWLAAAAALVLATLVGVRYTRGPQTDPAPAGANPVPSANGSAQAAESIESELRLAESHYENAIKGLEAIANSEQNELDPRTAATLQKNLAVIDQAISESRAAVRAQPANEPAQQSLIDGFKTKIGLLQDTVALINEMRKGNEAGAARIASGLKQKGT